jgi:hypothetical protein
MTDTAASPTAPGIDIEAIVKAATDAATAAVNTAIKPLSDELGSLKQSLANVPTPESITKTVTDAVAAQQTQQSQVNARQAFINENLKGVPDAFHSMIGNDPAKFREQADTLLATLKSGGFKIGDQSGGDASGDKPGGNSGGGDDARKATIEKLVKEKLGGNADLGKLLTGGTEEELTAQADAVLAQFKQLAPDFGGAAAGGDGGDTPTDTTAAESGGFLKMPGAATPAPAQA